MRINKSLLNIVVSAALCVSGIIAIAFDFAKDWLEPQYSIPIAFLTALSGCYALIYYAIYNSTKSLIDKTYGASIRELLSLYGISREPSLNELSNNSSQELIHNFLYVITKSIHKSPRRKINYNNDLETEYYIYSLSAAHSTELLQQMSSQIIKIVNKIVAEINLNVLSNNDEELIPVIIIPYGRNVLLGENVANMLTYPILVGQNTSADNFTPIDARTDTYEHLYQSFSGIETLEAKIKEISINSLIRKKIVIHGILLDDNVTSASQICKVANHYNNNIVKNSAKLESQLRDILHIDDDISITFKPVTSIATLFIAHENAVTKLKENIKSVQCKIYFYAILSETIKEKLCINKQNIVPYNVADSSQKRCVSDISTLCFDNLDDDINNIIKVME